MCGECNWPIEDKKREELTLPYLKGPKNDWRSIECCLPKIGQKVKVKNEDREEYALFAKWTGGFYFKIGKFENQIWQPTHWKHIGDL